MFYKNNKRTHFISVFIFERKKEKWFLKMIQDKPPIFTFGFVLWGWGKKNGIIFFKNVVVTLIVRFKVLIECLYYHFIL